MPLSWFGTWVQERHDSASSCLNLISIEFAYLFLLSWNSCSAFPYLGSWTCSRATVSPVFSGQQCGSHNMSENHLGYFCVCVCVLVTKHLLYFPVLWLCFFEWEPMGPAAPILSAALPKEWMAEASLSWFSCLTCMKEPCNVCPANPLISH